MQTCIHSLRAIFAAMLLLITGIGYSQNWSSTMAVTAARSGLTVYPHLDSFVKLLR